MDEVLIRFVQRAVKHATFPSPTPLFTIFGHHRVWAVGEAIYFRPATETPFDFLRWHLEHTVGADWLASQRALPVNRHALVDWIEAYDGLRASNRPDGLRPGETFTGRFTGYSKEVVALAHNLFLLRVGGTLNDHLIERLRGSATFQGVQYEITIAAALVRSGFEVDWIKRPPAGPDGKIPKRPEFVARHLIAQESLFVEAKSKHWPGVMGRPGAPSTEYRPKIHRQINDALSHRFADGPFGIFVDVHVPASPQQGRTTWQAELSSVVDRLTVDDRRRISLLVITNIPWHFAGEGDPTPLEAAVVRFAEAVAPLKDHTVAAVADALNWYGLIDPTTFFEAP